MTAGRKSLTDNKDWLTPPEYIAAVCRVFDNLIALDPCSNRYSQVHANVEYRLPEDDGLERKWDYPTIYVNPPYGRDSYRGTSIRDWLNKCTDAFHRYKSEVIALVPVATNTKHWQENVFKYATSICFLKVPRLKFWYEGLPTDKGAPMSCAVIYWGKNKEKFKQVFAEFGRVVEL